MITKMFRIIRVDADVEFISLAKRKTTNAHFADITGESERLKNDLLSSS